MRKSKNLHILSSIIIFVILVGLVFLTNVPNNELSYLQNLSNKIKTPINYLKLKFSGDISGGEFSSSGELLTEYNNLRLENESLKSELEAYKILETENQELQAMLNLKRQYSNFETVPLKITNKTSNNFTSYVTLDGGKDQEIQEDMTVVTSEGLYGKVISVSDTTCKVQTIMDPASKITVNIGQKDESIILQGTIDKKGMLIANLIPLDFEMASEEAVFTAGIGGVYPKGIYIGSVNEIFFPPNQADRYALIKPSVNFNSTDQVLVIKK